MAGVTYLIQFKNDFRTKHLTITTNLESDSGSVNHKSFFLEIPSLKFCNHFSLHQSIDIGSANENMVIMNLP